MMGVTFSIKEIARLRMVDRTRREPKKTRTHGIDVDGESVEQRSISKLDSQTRDFFSRTSFPNTDLATVAYFKWPLPRLRTRSEGCRKQPLCQTADGLRIPHQTLHALNEEHDEIAWTVVGRLAPPLHRQKSHPLGRVPTPLVQESTLSAPFPERDHGLHLSEQTRTLTRFLEVGERCFLSREQV